MAMNYFRAVAVAMFCLVCFPSHAQSWSEYQSWFKYGDGIENLALFAHPTSDFVRGSVESASSSNMIVKIVFDSFTLGNYTGR